MFKFRELKSEVVTERNKGKTTEGGKVRGEIIMRFEYKKAANLGKPRAPPRKRRERVEV